MAYSSRNFATDCFGVADLANGSVDSDVQEITNHPDEEQTEQGDEPGEEPHKEVFFATDWF